MKGQKCSIEEAREADRTSILSLLESVGLPTEGVSERPSDFLVARDADGKVIGCIGLERYGSVGLLRSAAVTRGCQHSGIGSRLTFALLDRATKQGLTELALLTTTAQDFFARFGFRKARRDEYEEKLGRSPEWRLGCCSSAVLMKIDLENPAPNIKP